MTQASYPGSTRPVKSPALSLSEDIVRLAFKRHFRRREEVMEAALRDLYELLASDEGMAQVNVLVRAARGLAWAALTCANTCWHCGHRGTPDDPVVDRSYEGHMLNERGQNVSSGQLIPDQACRDHRRCIMRQEAIDG